MASRSKLMTSRPSSIQNHSFPWNETFGAKTFQTRNVSSNQINSLSSIFSLLGWFKQKKLDSGTKFILCSKLHFLLAVSDVWIPHANKYLQYKVSPSFNSGDNHPWVTDVAILIFFVLFFFYGLRSLRSCLCWRGSPSAIFVTEMASVLQKGPKRYRKISLHPGQW